MTGAKGYRRRPRGWPGVLAGVVLGLALTFAVLRLLPRAPLSKPATVAPALAGYLLPEDTGSIDELLFMYVPELEPLVASSYEDFLMALDPATRLVAVVPKASDSGRAPGAPALAAFLARIDPSGALARRTRVVEAKGPITVWSKDRALVLSPTTGQRTTFVIPVPPDPRWRERTNDWATLAAVATRDPDRYFVHELPLEFDAGDFAVTADRIIVDDNLFTKNKARGIKSTGELTELLRKLFARDVLLLGSGDGDVPRHHMSMYMAPLGDVVLVGDPRAGRDLLGADYSPGELSPDSGEPFRADFSQPMLDRYDRAVGDLAAAGYRVERVPTVPFDDKTYIAYTNGIYETRAGKKIAYVPEYGISQLDDVARLVYEKLGWEVRRVRVRAAYPFHGTIGCLANVLARGR
jgi:hypothetical protein